MQTNYDNRTPGRAYLRVPLIAIGHPSPGSGASPDITVTQEWAVKLESGVVQALKVTPAVPEINSPVDVADQTPIPMVNLDSGLPLDAATLQAVAAAIAAGVVTMPIAMLVVGAVVRHLQAAHNPPPGG